MQIYIFRIFHNSILTDNINYSNTVQARKKRKQGKHVSLRLAYTLPGIKQASDIYWETGKKGLFYSFYHGR